MRLSKPKIIVALLSVVTIVACTKKRKEYFGQGQGQNLYAMSIGKKYSLDTKQKTGKKADLSAAREIIISKNNLGLSSLDIVNYTTDSEILKNYGEVVFVGKENTHYDLEYEFTEKNLIIHKIGTEDSIPKYQLRVAEEAGESNGKKLFKVPVLGCPVTYVHVENQLNRNRQKTKTLTEVGVKFPKEASHFKMDETRCREFSHAAKKDIFEANFFDGTWYFAETLVKTEDKWAPLVGWEIAGDFRGKPAKKIKFLRFRDAIHAVNENVDERLAQEDINKNTAVSIPVADWYDFALDGNDELKETTDNSHSWDNRKHLGIDLRYMYSAAFPFTFDGSDVLELEVGVDKNNNDYFSVTLQKNMFNSGVQTMMRIKYAFLRAGPRQYTPKVYFKDDEDLFGYFVSERDFVKNHENDRKGDMSRYRFLSRLNPNPPENKYEFRFSRTSKNDPRLRNIALKAVKAWEAAFRQAGLNITFDLKMDPSFDVSLGDLRYYVINFVESVSTTGLIGVGPSISDPFTGEIISATANIQLSSIRDIFARILRHYVRSQLGAFDKNYMCIRDRKSLELTSEVVLSDNVRAKCNTFEKLAEPFITKLRRLPECTEVQNLINRYKPSIKSLEDLVSQRAAIDPQEELKSISSCVEKMSEDMILSSLVHELGHNLGLRHNFRGSSDSSNFWSAGKTGGIVMGSSAVMEYLAPFQEELTLPGKYEVAAILFGYNDRIVKKGAFDGDVLDLQGTVKIDPKFSIKENLKFKMVNLAETEVHRFAYCTDEDTQAARLQDPMCMQFDAGNNPLDIVNNLIARFEVDYTLGYYRYDREYVLDQRVTSGQNTGNIFWMLKNFYDRWRFKIKDEFAPNDPYFESYISAEEYEADLKRWSEIESKGIYGNKGFLQASERVYEFLKQLFFIPDRHCVVKKGSEISLEHLDTIRIGIRSGRAGANPLSSSLIVSCASAGAQEYLKNKGYDQVQGRDGLAYHIDEIGIDRQNTYFDVNRMVDLKTGESGADRNFDVSGIDADIARLMWDVIVQRDKMEINLHRQLFPHFLDEPTNRKDMFMTSLEKLFENIVIKVSENNGIYSAEVVEQIPVDLALSSERPAWLKVFTNVAQDKQKTLQYMNELTERAYTIDEFLDPYHRTFKSRRSRSMSHEVNVNMFTPADPKLSSLTVKTTVDTRPNIVFGVISDGAYVAKALVGRHMVAKEQLKHLREQQKTKPDPSFNERQRLLLEQIEILEGMFMRTAVDSRTAPAATPSPAN